MTRQRSRRTLPPWWEELRENLSVEFIGLIIFLVGGFLLLSLLPSSDPFPRALPWLTQMVGWTAPLLTLALLVLGAVLMVGSRAGYWSVEAIIGAELLLLALQMGTFTWQNNAPNWAPQLDGAGGGLVGATLGSLLIAGFGRELALLLIVLVGASGLYLLMRYTPLFFLYRGFFNGMPLIGAAVALWEKGKARLHTPSMPEPSFAPPQGANFVSAQDPEPPTAAGGRTKSHAAAAQPADPPLAEPAAGPRPTSDQPGQPPAATAKRAGRNRRTKVDATDLQAAPAGGPLPALDLLVADHARDERVDVQALQQLIETTLADFNVPVRTIHVESGPTVTQFGVEPLYLERAGQRRKVRVSRIVNLADDLALALAVPAVRIEAPVPGRPYVGIEVPNLEKKMVTLRGILESKAMQQGGALALPLGRNTAGAPVVMDLTKAPHILIAGATGAGKSVCINAIVTGLLMQHGPDRLRFIMVDPKMVELPGYNGIPHLLGNVITDVEQVMGALTWLLLQMDDRYRLFQQAGVRNLENYNAKMLKGKKGAGEGQPLPYIVLIIDELADLMMTAAEDVERQICRLAQMARATGIHLILATQRPSVDVVTGLIKANFPSRIAFAVTSQTDSRVILDTPGAERLLGRGDMLVMRSDVAKLGRVQGCMVGEDEIARVVAFWRQQATLEGTPTPPPWSALMDRLDDEEELLQEALDAVQGLTQVTTSQLQRKLRIGYPKAARLVEKLEEKGFLGPDQGAGQGRKVLLKKEDEEEEVDR
ncbi:MAG: cell division protein FtsK [Chloroflexi bacterium]|nr:MAG: cell division protein FtsK [Chloroflexota bacterium]